MSQSLTKKHSNEMPSKRIRLIVAGLWFGILFVITLGALTRLLDAGLGCPDWPGCYGWLMPPTDPEQVALAHVLFPSWPVEHTKAWMEMIHRYFASALGLLIILQIALLKNWDTRTRMLTWVQLGCVCIQGAFGAWTVTMKLWPPVVTGHLLGGFILLMLQSWIWVQIAANPGIILKNEKLAYWSLLPIGVKRLVMFSSGLLLLQVIIGGWTSSQYAGLVCPDLPYCQGKWWPDRIQFPWAAPWPDGQDALGGLLTMADRMAIHMTHRFVALLLFVVELTMLVTIARYLPHERNWMLLVGFCLLLQVLLGVANIVFNLPLTLALLHNTGAALLWASHWVLIARLTYQGEHLYAARRLNV